MNCCGCGSYVEPGTQWHPVFYAVRPSVRPGVSVMRPSVRPGVSVMCGPCEESRLRPLTRLLYELRNPPENKTLNDVISEVLEGITKHI